MDSERRLAMVFRICVSATSVKSVWDLELTTRAAWAGACAAASMSRVMMRPPGPEPWTAERSKPRSEASRRASGEERTWPPLGVDAAEGVDAVGVGGAGGGAGTAWAGGAAAG